MFRTLALLVALVSLGQLAACSPGADLPPLPPSNNASYTLAPGDQVRVITFGDQTLTGDFYVDDGGDILLPLLGPVHAAGLTTHQLTTAVNDSLRKKDLFRNPSVAVEVIAYRPIYVLGEVNRPGQYPYQPSMTVLGAVAAAGGFTYRAVVDYASIVRTDGRQAVEGKVARETLVQPGDVITVYERKF
jgi:polysaccharide export outer membrane protein